LIRYAKQGADVMPTSSQPTEGPPVTSEEAKSTSSAIGLGQATAGSISSIGLLDLTHVTSPDQLDQATDISSVGVILVRESVAARLGTIPMQKVGAIATVPDGAKLVRHAGTVRWTGEALGAAGHEDEILVLAGVAIITTPVERIAYRSLIVVGVLLAPEGSEQALSAASVTGSVAYYPAGAALRVVFGAERYGREFFDYLPEPVNLVVMGDLVIEADVPVDTVREKVRNITLLGTVHAPANVVPLLQALTPEKLGEIRVLTDEPAVPPRG
jgi:hypothetical protein